jgi:hypothetical protein
MSYVPYYGYGYGGIGLGTQEVLINPANVAQNVVIQQVPQQQIQQQTTPQSTFALLANIAMAQALVNNGLTISSLLPSTTQAQSVSNLLYQLLLNPIIGNVVQNIGAYQASSSGSYLASLQLSLGYNLSSQSNFSNQVNDVYTSTLSLNNSYTINPTGSTAYNISFPTNSISFDLNPSTSTATIKFGTTGNGTAPSNLSNISGLFTITYQAPVTYNFNGILDTFIVEDGTASTTLSSSSLSSTSFAIAESSSSTSFTITYGGTTTSYSDAYISSITFTSANTVSVTASGVTSFTTTGTATTPGNNVSVAAATVNVVFVLSSATSLTNVNSSNTTFYYFPLTFVFSQPDQSFNNTLSTAIIPQDTKTIEATVGMTSGQYLYVGLQIPNTINTFQPLQIMQPSTFSLIPLPGVPSTAVQL